MDCYSFLLGDFQARPVVRVATAIRVVEIAWSSVTIRDIVGVVTDVSERIARREQHRTTGTAFHLAHPSGHMNIEILFLKLVVG